MTHRQVLKILMLSPVYFMLKTRQRMQLVKEYRRQFSEIVKDRKEGKTKISSKNK